MNKNGRWFYGLAGFIVLIFAGFVYGWSVYGASIGADFPEWSKAQLSLTFTICMACFCLGSFLAGNLSKRLNVRVNIYVSAGLFLAGFLIASRAESLFVLYAGYGVLGGFGSGFAYNAVMSTITKWFPDKPGLISGMLLMGFGSSSLMLGSVFTAVTPAQTGAWRATFLVMGIITAAVLAASSFFFKPPSPGTAPAGTAKAKSGGGRDYSPAEMVRTPYFWLFFLWAILISGIGLAVISQAKVFASGIGPDVGGGVLTFVVGLVSVCNGLGRLLFGWLFDKLGWRTTMITVNGAGFFSVIILFAALISGQFWLVVLGFIVTGISYGGAPTMCSAVIGGFFGRKNYPVNFSIINMNLLAASFSGTLAGALYDASGGYTTTLIAIGCSAAAAFAVLFFIRERA
ncbi:MAG: MFS transporter [Clostridiales bacterium]|jgi:OFA family oxalate/formate antiporter-like MFS transporter|nr:MFS transporter [Clostridiales bacterium]